MYEEMRVKYLFINLRYPAYLKLQIALVAAWLVVSLLCFSFTKNSSMWILKNAWWLCIIVALLEVGESLVAINKAKKDFNIQSKNDNA
jgi:hypothetical protein